MAMEAIQVAPEVRKGRVQLAVTVILGHAIKHIYNSGLQSTIMPELKAGLDLSNAAYGTLATSRQTAGWVTTMTAGFLGDRFASKAALMLGISLGLMGIAQLLAGVAPGYGVLFLAMLLIGIGPSLYHPPAIGALSRRFPDKRGLAISLHGTGGSIGEVIGPTLAGVLITVVLLTWRQVLVLSLFPAIIAAFAIWSMMRSVPGGESGKTMSMREYFASLGSLLTRRPLLLLVLVTALRSMGQSSVSTFLPVYLREDLDYSALEVGFFLSLAQFVGIGAQPAMGFLSDRFGRKAVLVPSMGLLGLLVIALYYASAGVQLTLTIIALGAFLYSLHSIFIASAMDVAGEKVHSTVVSLIYGASFLGTFSPVVAGVIADNFGTRTAFIYGGIIVLVGTLVLAATRLPRTAVQVARGH